LVTKIGNNAANTLNGTSTADTLYGRGGNDILNGLAGADKLYGEAGNDILKGGLGNDRLDGGAGTDRISFYNDGGTRGVTVDLALGTVVRGTERDTLISIEDVYGSSYGDLIKGTAGANRLEGGSGNDEIYGQDGDDTIIGGSGHDELHGGKGNDYIYDLDDGDFDFFDGGEGNDRFLWYGDGNVVRGGAGNDVFEAITASDSILTGGQGADVYEVGSGGTGFIPPSSDFVTDFSQSDGDKIDLSGWDALPDEGRQPFEFIGDAELTEIGQLRYYFYDGGTYFQSLDANGNAVTYACKLDGFIEMTASDFIL